MRGWIADTGNYADPIALGSVMKALAVGEVVETTDPAWRTGDWVTGWFGRQEFASVRSEAILHHLREDDLPPSLALGALGINGVTALLCLTQWGARRTAALCRGHAGGAGGLP